MSRAHVKNRFKAKHRGASAEAAEQVADENGPSSFAGTKRESSVMNAFPAGYSSEGPSSPESFHAKTAAAQDLIVADIEPVSDKHTKAKAARNKEIMDYVATQKGCCTVFCRRLHGKSSRVSRAELEARFPSS